MVRRRGGGREGGRGTYRGDEEDAGEIVGQVEVVVGEGVVLLGV